MLKAILFDFDGTLVDTEREYIHNFDILIKDHNVSSKEEDIPYLLGKSALQKAEYMNEKYGAQIDGMMYLETFRQMNRDTIYTKVHKLAYPDAEGALRLAKKRGMDLFICSNTPSDRIRYALELFHWEDFFTDILSGSDLDMRKPSPKIYDYFLKKYGYKKEEVLVVEDSPNGIVSSKNAGIQTAGLCRLCPKEMMDADYFLDTLDDLEPLLDRLSA